MSLKRRKRELEAKKNILLKKARRAKKRKCAVLTSDMSDVALSSPSPSSSRPVTPLILSSSVNSSVGSPACSSQWCFRGASSHTRFWTELQQKRKPFITCRRFDCLSPSMCSNTDPQHTRLLSSPTLSFTKFSRNASGRCTNRPSRCWSMLKVPTMLM